ncbi:MAG: hypothetical protein HOP11_00210 [Saprospiraceae bacterium]|nr:hypothetical protein [Saprospiraceae bacterium]
MKLEVREIHESEIEIIVNYFVAADEKFLKGIGADINKLPKRTIGNIIRHKICKL